MNQPVVHFEVIDQEPEKLRGFYGDLFGSSTSAFPTSRPRCARRKAWAGRAAWAPRRTPGRIVVGHFTDPQGNLIGVAGPA
jgi:predicted enzyme related to lactoylglutathione lyase